MGAKQLYDVAISFAGEDREKASALADALKRQSVAVFYDHYADLWGLDLYSRLADGITTPEILEEWNRIKLKERNERKRIGLDTQFDDSALDETRRILKAMERAKAEAVDYLPEEYKDLPLGQRRLIVELLNLDDPQHTTSQGALNNTILGNARSRIYDFADAKSREAALKRIDDLEEALGF